MTKESSRSNYEQVRRVLWAVLFANLAVTVVKISLGFVTGALAVIADGFHSLVDSSSNLIGLAAIRLAGRPADEDHPYGYSRYETMGTLAIGGLLLVAAYEVGESIIERLVSGAEPTFTPLTIWLVILTFPVNLAVYLLERRAGTRLKSEVLLADASHTRTDLFVTLSVIASILGVQLGLGWLDLVIAAVVVVLIVRAAFQILRKASATLADRMVATPEEVSRVALEVPGVVYVHQVRSRGAPGAGFVDLHVKVHSGMSTEQAHSIASEVERRLRSELPEIAEALVHIEPAAQRPSRMERIRYDLRRITDGMGLSFHDLHVHAEDDGSYTVELHLEMPADVSLGEAHKIADRFEARVAEQATQPIQIITHLEPIPDRVLYPDPVAEPQLREEVRKLILQRTGRSQLNALQMYQLGQRMGVSATVTARADSSLSEAHAMSEAIERELLNRFPEIHRVTVHVEPDDRNPEEEVHGESPDASV